MQNLKRLIFVFLFLIAVFFSVQDVGAWKKTTYFKIWNGVVNALKHDVYSEYLGVATVSCDSYVKVDLTVNGVNNSMACDTAPPTVVWSPATINSYVKGSQTFTATCSDGVGTGCVYSTYTCTVNYNGQTCSVTVRDKAGNSAVYYSPVAKIDNTPPTVVWNPVTITAYLNTSQSFVATCNDPLSGCTEGTKSCSVTQNGGTCSVTFSDNVGNTATYTSPVAKIDNTAPTVTWNPNNPTWISTDQAFTATCSDALSGCIKTTDSCTVSTNGKTCNITAEDKAGNSAVYYSPVAKIDKISPTLTWNPASSYWTKMPSQTLMATCSDTGGSGCKSGENLTCVFTKHGETCTKTAHDNAGNASVSIVSPVAWIDTLPPVCGNVTVSPSDWTDVGKPVTMATTCTDPATNGTSGQSGCVKEDVSVEVGEAGEFVLTVKDVAGNETNCDAVTIKQHYVEVRGTSTANATDRGDLAMVIRQNVADLTRNVSPQTYTSGEIKFNINNNIAYYKGDVTLNNLTVSGKKTLILESGDLNINGKITYQDASSILGIIVLKAQSSKKGNVTVLPSVTDVNAILYAEGTLKSTNDEDQNINQLYWKGSIITDNTIGGYSSTPMRCPKQVTNCTPVLAKEGDLRYMRSYYPGDEGTASSDPKKSSAPFIIEYDARVQQNVPYGFEMSGGVNFQEIVK